MLQKMPETLFNSILKGHNSEGHGDLDIEFLDTIVIAIALD